jgi:uncharacterized SAM-binding protein YcdF (DUF218 family)
MFVSDLCYRELPDSLFKLPLLTDWSHIGWRKQLLLVVLIGLVIFGIRWIIQHKSARRWLRSTKAMILLFCITAGVPLVFALAAKGLVAFLPPDTGATAEAIVVLGRGRELERERLDVAAELWQAKRAPRIFVSGKDDAYSMIPKFEAQGIPDRAVDGDNCSRTTLENALVSAAILHPQGIRQILLVTDEPHMLRSLLLFRANGFTVIPHPNTLPANFGLKSRVFLTIREYMGVIGYSLQGLFHRQHSSEVDNPDLKQILQLAKQYGQQKRLSDR